MEEWRLLDIEYSDPYMNLAVEEAIPRMVGKGAVPATVRFWRNPNAVVIGRFQCVELEVNVKVCKTYGIRIVRRFTGGGAVYHDRGNLNYAISVRNNHSLIPNDILEIYNILSMGVIEGLRLLQLNAKFAPVNNIQIDDKKISGMAASLNWGVVFLHGSLLVNTNLNVLSEVLDIPERQIALTVRGVRSVKKSVTTIRDEMGRDISMSEVKEALTKGFEDSYGIDLVEEKLTKEEEELALKLYEEKYIKDEWNFER
jgi:lipoate-protein ligase A